MRVFGLIVNVIGAIALVFVMECFVAICGLNHSDIALFRFALYALMGLRIGARFKKGKKEKKVKVNNRKARV